MTRGHPPMVAIAEAMHYAERIGFSVIGVHACWLASDFLAISEGKITLVRVRRLRYTCYGLPDIVASRTQEILELRSTPVAENTSRELRVRGICLKKDSVKSLKSSQSAVEYSSLLSSMPVNHPSHIN